MKYSESFNNLHILSINAKAPIEDFDARDPVQLATENIASILGLLMTAEANQELVNFRGEVLSCLGGLTEDEWDNIRRVMLVNISLLTNSNKSDYTIRRTDWVRDLETIYALGES